MPNHLPIYLSIYLKVHVLENNEGLLERDYAQNLAFFERYSHGE